ncbi:hypothetical protein BDR06DRAFT_1014930 [Suillus hirtellus]|nr:hypothetical protein BDR06DRAFT_1014930 [Suillus hirtellus]
MADVADNWIVADSEDEDALRSLQIADQSNLLSGTPFSTGPENILQPPTLQIASFITSQAQTPRRGREPLDTSSASAISASTLASDSIRPPTTPSAVSDLIEDVDPVFSIADRVKTRTRKTQVKKATYVPVNDDPPRKRSLNKTPSILSRATLWFFLHRKSQRFPQVSFTTLCLPSSIPALPDLSSPPSYPPEMTRKRKKVSPFQSEVHGEEIDVDVPDTSSSSIIAPLFSVQLSPVVPVTIRDSSYSHPYFCLVEQK